MKSAVAVIVIVFFSIVLMMNGNFAVVHAKAPSQTVKPQDDFYIDPGFDAFLRAPQAADKKPVSKGVIPLPEGPGKEITERTCANCHSTDVWVKQRHTREKWSSIIDNMVSKGMEASDDDLAVINDYLALKLGPNSPAAMPATTPTSPPATPPAPPQLP